MNQNIFHIQQPRNSEVAAAAAAVAQSVSVAKHSKELLHCGEFNKSDSIQNPHHSLTEPSSLNGFSYRVKPNPAVGNAEMHVLRHCVQQQT